VVEKDLVGILLSPYCLIWTIRGLLTVEELEQEDVLICLDEKGELNTKKLDEKPSFNGPRNLVSLITESNSTILAEDAEIYTSRGKMKVKNVEVGNKIEMLSAQQCIDIITMITVNQNQIRENKLTEEIAFLLGKSKFKIRNKNEVIFTTQNESEFRETMSMINKFLKPVFGGKVFQRMSKRGYSYISGGMNLVYQSKKFCEVCSSIDLDKDKIPKFLRCFGFAIMKEFFLGFLERYRVGPKLAVIKLRRDAPLSRTFIQNIAWITGKPIMKKHFSQEYHILKILTDTSKNSVNKRSNYSKVIEKYSSLGKGYVLKVPANWDPIVDNFYVRRHNIKYPMPLN